MLSSPLSTDVKALWGFEGKCYTAACFVLCLFCGLAAWSQSNLRPKLWTISGWLLLNSWPNKIIRWISTVGIICYNFKRPEDLSNTRSCDRLRLSNVQCILWLLNQAIFLLNFQFCILLLKLGIKSFPFCECQAPENKCILVIHFQQFTICNPFEIYSWNWIMNFWRNNWRKFRICSLEDGRMEVRELCWGPLVVRIHLLTTVNFY